KNPNFGKNNVKDENQESSSNQGKIKQESSSNSISMNMVNTGIHTQGLNIDEDDDVEQEEEDDIDLTNENESKVDKQDVSNTGFNQVINIKISPTVSSQVPNTPLVTGSQSDGQVQVKVPTKPPIQTNPYFHSNKRTKLNDEESLRVKKELLQDNSNIGSDNEALFGSPMRFNNYQMPGLEKGTNEFSQDQVMNNNSFSNYTTKRSPSTRRSPRKRGNSPLMTPPPSSKSEAVPTTHQDVTIQKIIYEHSRKDTANLNKGVSHWFKKEEVNKFLKHGTGNQVYGLINALKSTKTSRFMVPKGINQIINSIPLQLSRQLILAYAQQHSKIKNYMDESKDKSEIKKLRRKNQEVRDQKDELKEAMKGKDNMIRELTVQIDGLKELNNQKVNIIINLRSQEEASQKAIKEAQQALTKCQEDLRREGQRNKDVSNNLKIKHEKELEAIKQDYEKKMKKLKKNMESKKLSQQKEINELHGKN
ncbi:MAG: hypothetical protein ACPGII_10220, partial [Opitutales bacterium]